jgi:hypothetical protein
MIRQAAAAMLVAVLVLAGAIAPTWASYRCVDTVVRSECCCPAPAGDGERQPVTRSACCEITTNQPSIAPPVVTEHGPPLVVLPAALWFAAAPAPPETRAHFADVPRERGLGPPIFRLTRALLI